MSATISSILQKSKTFFITGSINPAAPKSSLPSDSLFTQAPEATSLFPTVSPETDGEDCDHDCETCEVKYPKGWKIDEDQKLYGQINGWQTHMLVATGKTDWVRDVADEGGSVMEAVGNWKKKIDGEPSNGKLMLSASNIPPPPDNCVTEYYDAKDKPTTVLLLPAFMIIEGVTPARVPELIEHVVATAPTNTTPLDADPAPAPSDEQTNGASTITNDNDKNNLPTTEETDSNGVASTITTIPQNPTPPTPTTDFTTRPSPHRYLILLCSQKTRDARCGQSAPLLRREFERHLRPLGLYRDMHDERPGGVGIYFISHVGGHKFSANVMVYRRLDVGVRHGDRLEEGKEKGTGGMGEEAAQCIWLGRVRPEDCEGIVKFTVLQGKVVKPERQLRGGFDRGKGLVSW